MTLPENPISEEGLFIIHAGTPLQDVEGCGGQVYNLFNRLNTPLTKLELALCRFSPGDTAQEHRHMWTEELYFVTCGKGIIVLNGERHTVELGSSIAIPIGVWHQIRNESDQLLEFISINSCPYDPEDFHIRT